MSMGPREGRTLHAMGIDDAYEVQRVLASGPGGKTEVVTIDGLGPYLRKKIPLPLVDRRVWAVLAECANPRLPHVVASYETPDEFAVVCDFVPGDTVNEVVDSEGRLPVSRAVGVTLEICGAIEDLHRHGIAHCDISPRNVLLAADGSHLIDLGIARLTGTKPSSESPNLGTYGFAAPEQYGFAPSDERTDVYSTARLLGFMLTGVEPGDAYQAALADETIVPAPLRAVVERGSAFEPSARYQTMGEFAAALSVETRKIPSPEIPRNRDYPRDSAAAPQAVRTENAEGRPLPHAAAAAPSSRRKRHAAIACAVAGAVVLLIAAGLLLRAPLLDTLRAGTATLRNMDIASPVEERPPLSPGTQSPDEPANASNAEPPPAKPPSAGSSQSKTVFPEEDLVVVEHAWYPAGNYFYYVFALRNESEDLTVDYPAVNIVGRDADGKVVSSDQAVLTLLNPGETMYFTSLAGTGSTVPRTVEFLPVAPEEYQVHPPQSRSAAFRVVDASASTTATGRTAFTGEVVCDEDDGGTDSAFGIHVVVALRDAAGNLVGAAGTFADCPKPGSSVAFETMGEEVPDYVSVEAYAYAW